MNSNSDRSVVTIGIVQRTSSCQLWTTLSPLDWFTVHCMNYYIVQHKERDLFLFLAFAHRLLQRWVFPEDDVHQRRRSALDSSLQTFQNELHQTCEWVWEDEINMPKIPPSEYFCFLQTCVWVGVGKRAKKFWETSQIIFILLQGFETKGSESITPGQIYHLIQTQASPGIARVKILVNCGYCLWKFVAALLRM